MLTDTHVILRLCTERANHHIKDSMYVSYILGKNPWSELMHLPLKSQALMGQRVMFTGVTTAASLAPAVSTQGVMGTLHHIGTGTQVPCSTTQLPLQPTVQ